MSERFVNFAAFQSDPRFGQWYATVRRQPTWAWKIAGFAAALVIIVPIVMMVLTAIATFIVVFAVLSIAHRLGDWVGRLFGRRDGSASAPGVGWPDDGRRGVRVITTEFRPNE